MAIDERLLLTLEARVAKYEKDLARARQRTDQHGRAMQARMLRTSTAISASFASIAAPLAGAMSLRGATALIDASVRIDNALKVAGLSGEALEKVYDRLFDAAQANAAPIETLVGLYSKLALVQNELGVSQEELVGFSSNVALALRVGGTDAKAASGALLQLSQALGGGTVRAEEFNSVLEGAPTIAQAVANGLEEAGGSVAKLRQLVVNGEVSSRAFFRAFEAGAPMLQEKVADAVMTIDQRMTNLGNALLDAARRFNASTEAANTFGTAIDNVAGFVNGIDFDALISHLREVAAAFQAGAQWAQNFGRSVGEATGLDAVGKFLTGGSVQKSFLGGALTVTSSKALQERINSAFEGQIQKAGELTQAAILQSVLGQGGGATAKGDRLQPTTFKPVSIAEFPVDPTGSAGKGSAAGSKSTADFARQIADAQRRAELLRTETALLAGINPALDQYGAKAEAASLKAQLLTAAQAEGVALTPDVLANIDRVADAYGAAAEEAAKLAEEQDRVKETAEEIANLAGSVVSGFVADLRAGKSASEALAGALNRVVDKLVEVAIQALIVGPLLKALGGGGGWLSWLGLNKGGEVQKMASGGRVRGPGTGRSDSIPAMLSNGEHVINARSAAKWRPMLEAINADRVPGFRDGGVVGASSRLGSGGGASINFAPTINVQAAQGGDARQNADLARQTAAQVEASLRGLVAQEIATQLRPGNVLARAR